MWPGRLLDMSETAVPISLTACCRHSTSKAWASSSKDFLSPFLFKFCSPALGLSGEAAQQRGDCKAFSTQYYGH